METHTELLNAARARNKDALAKIFDLYASALFKYARRLCGDPLMADQIVGDVFAKFLEKYRGVKDQHPICGHISFK